MKKFFTLIAVALVAISASAQENSYKDLGDQITNGTIPYKKAGYTEADLPNFVSAEWVEGEKVSTVSRVVVDPADVDALEAGSLSARTANYCLAAATRVVDEGVSTDPWDSRFYITLPIALAKGDKVKFSMKVKAKKAATIGAQGHGDATGNAYVTYRMGDFLNNVAVPGEGDTGENIDANGWLTYAPAEFEWGDFEGVNTFAFDIGASAGNEFYFDDIKCEVQQKFVKEMVWKEIFSNDGTDATPFSVKYFKNYTTPKSEDGAIVVTSLDPDKTYAEYYMEDDNGNAVEAKLANNWDTQFLIPLGTDLEGGKKFKIAFRYKADKAAGSESQVHMAPPAAGAIESKGLGEYPEYGGTYIHYQLPGISLSFTDEWQWFNEDLSTVTSVPSQATAEKPMGAVCFNLSVLRESINYYFDDIKVFVDEDDVPTAISEVKAQKIAKTIYNVAGQQIQSLQKGLNIVNGQKVYVK